MGGQVKVDMSGKSRLLSETLKSTERSHQKIKPQTHQGAWDALLSYSSLFRNTSSMLTVLFFSISSRMWVYTLAVVW